jgi:poly-gamma-glutamate synthesis protein (capsule biosynthesis protein)
MPGFTGRVIDMDGKPVSGAEVQSQTGSTTSGQDGSFVLPSEGAPQWITVTRQGFISRTRAAAPGAPALFRLAPDDGETIVIQFGGDTMFGRRFFDPNEDGDSSDGLLPNDPDVTAHLRLLEPIRPILGQSDLTVLNLESPLTDTAYFSVRDARPTVYHTTKDYVFSSDTSAVGALKRMGVDVVDIGNNHLYDLLESGLQSTISALEAEGMQHFGGGTNEASAWAPVIMNVKGQRVAFIGCTTIKQPIPPATANDISFVASDALGKGGAAFCEELQLHAAIIRAKLEADIVIAMIHGGYEYARQPSNQMARLTTAARNAGATLVINHHPHVIGGFSWDPQSLVAWSMGNFVFDQDVWPTFESYLLTVYLKNGKIIRAFADPLMIEDYVPRGLTGQQADHVIRTAASESGPFVLENGVMEIDVAQQALQMEYTKSLDGGAGQGQIISVPPSQSIAGFKGTGTLWLGRDLLWIGGFEDEFVDGAPGNAPFWNTAKESLQVGGDYAYESGTGIRLTRSASNSSDAVTSHLHRVLINPRSHISITGFMRASPGATVLMQMSWYSNTKGPSSLRITEPIAVQSYDHWQSFRFDVQAPPEAVALSVFLRLVPPIQGNSTTDFDNIRIIEWTPEETGYSPFYDYARLTGTGELTFTQKILPGAEEWLTDPIADQVK